MILIRVAYATTGLISNNRAWVFGRGNHLVSNHTDVHPKLHDMNPHNVPRSLISRNSRERMFIVQISLLIVTFLSLISQFFWGH
jgi:hypothetical protein